MQTDLVGVKLSGVTKGAPAEQGGLKAGDVIVELAGRKIENIYDYTYAIEALKVGQPVTIKVRRGEESVDSEVVPPHGIEALSCPAVWWACFLN